MQIVISICSYTHTHIHTHTHRYRAAYQERFHQSNESLISYLCSGLQDQPAGVRIYSSQSNGGAANTSDAQKERQRRSRLCLFDTTPVRDMTLRQLRDSVQNLQLNWVPLSVAETMQPQAMEAVDALFHRFGVLASQVLFICYSSHVKSSKMAHFVFKCNKEYYLSLCYSSHVSRAHTLTLSWCADAGVARLCHG